MNQKIDNRIGFGILFLVAVIISLILILSSKQIENTVEQVKINLTNTSRPVVMKDFPDDSIKITFPRVSDVLFIGDEYTISWTPFKLSDDRSIEFWIVGIDGSRIVHIGRNCGEILPKPSEMDEYCFDSEKGSMKWRPGMDEWHTLRLTEPALTPIKYHMVINIGKYISSGGVGRIESEKEVISQDFFIVDSKALANIIEHKRKELFNPKIEITEPQPLEKIKVGDEYQVNIGDNSIVYGLCMYLRQNDEVKQRPYCISQLLGGKDMLTPASGFKVRISSKLEPGKYTAVFFTQSQCNQYQNESTGSVVAVCFPEREGSVDVEIIK